MSAKETQDQFLQMHTELMQRLSKNDLQMFKYGITYCIFLIASIAEIETDPHRTAGLLALVDMLRQEQQKHE